MDDINKTIDATFHVSLTASAEAVSELVTAPHMRVAAVRFIDLIVSHLTRYSLVLHIFCNGGEPVT